MNNLSHNIRLAFWLILAFLSADGIAQSYSTVGGIRLGTEFGITFRQLLHDNNTVEGIIQSNSRDDLTSFTVLSEFHNPLVSRRFNFFMGAGLHKGWYGNNIEADIINPWGVTLIGGAEMTLGKLNISWDYKPAINIRGGNQTIDSQTAISMRYVYAKRKRKKKNRKKDNDKWWQVWKKKEEKKEEIPWWKVWKRKKDR